MRLFLFLLPGLLAVTACGGGDPMQGFQPGEVGRVVRVMDGDSVVLDTGQSVRLVGIEAPAFGRDGVPDEPHAEESRRRLEDMVLGRRVRLYYAGLTRDRYDRALAHVRTEDRLGPVIWANEALAGEGAVRVRAYPDTAFGVEHLFEAEQQARADRLGLWALSYYRVRDARDLDAQPAGFLVLAGILAPRRPAPFDDTACQRALMGSEVTIIVDAPAMAACDMDTGLRVEARGWYRDGRVRLNAAVNLRVMPGDAFAMAGDNP